MATVTYKGPRNPADLTNLYVVPREKGGAVELRLGEAVEDVSADVVKALRADKDHEFEVGEKAS